MYIVTEYGMVNLKGKSVAERARALIGIAHPDFREQLERAAMEHRLIGYITAEHGLLCAGFALSARMPGDKEAVEPG